MITAPDQRLDLLSATGLDAVLVMEFTSELAGWTPERFVVDVFVKALGASLVVSVGEDTRFSVRNSGDVGTLRHWVPSTAPSEVSPRADVGRWSSAGFAELSVRSPGRCPSGAGPRTPHRMAGDRSRPPQRVALGYPTAKPKLARNRVDPSRRRLRGLSLIRTDALPDNDPDHRLRGCDLDHRRNHQP